MRFADKSAKVNLLLPQTQYSYQVNTPWQARVFYAYHFFMAVNRTPKNIAKTGGSFRIIAKLRAAVLCRVPVGYQDWTGFHFGRQPILSGEIFLTMAD